VEEEKIGFAAAEAHSSRMSVKETVAKPRAAVSFFPRRTKRQEKDQGVAQALAPGPRIAKGRGALRNPKA